jgi:aspartyl/glutamyl-tRNA(Asn/Gln) amidotransferase C subunit
MELADVQKLADLARIDMSEDEMKEVAKDFDSILAYVSQIQEFSKSNNPELVDYNQDNYFLNNVMREDVATNTKDQYSEKIINEFPDKQDRYLKVKQIL